VSSVLLLLSKLPLNLLLEMMIVLRILLFHKSNLAVLQLIGLHLSLTLLWRQLRTERSFVAQLSTVVTYWRSLWHLFTEVCCRRQLETRMHVFAGFAIRTKAGEIVFAKNSPHVPMPAAWSMSTEASVVPRAILNLAFRVNVEESALFLVAGVESGIEVALRHFRHVVFVKKLAAVSLLAESSQPMLANDGLLFSLNKKTQ
jgi:hypothetical protein